ncbi:MAG: Ig-like domain-containing protein [Fidelibacterota bacterium]|nr:MAG: Ig-like domain-containing protein [Candidatus Neomarinimicrobiota bacterium]
MVLQWFQLQFSSVMRYCILRPTLLLAALPCAALLWHCAAENPPTGGPPDTEGPRVIRVDPPSGTLDLDLNQTIEITFNEQVDPISVSSSMIFTPEVSFTARVRGKRVLIRPASTSGARTDSFSVGNSFGVEAGGFQDGRTYVLTLQRGIRDYRKNGLARSYQLVFSTGGNIPTGRIQGRITEFNTERSVGVGLFLRVDSGFVHVQSVDLAADSSFSFDYLADGTYRLAAVEGGLSGFPAAIHRRPYALSPADSLLIQGDTITTALCLSPPLSRPQIQSVEWITPTYVAITFDMPLGEAQLPPNLYPTDDPLTFGHLLRPETQTSDTTVIDLGLGHDWLGESYRLEPLAIPTPELVDTLPPISVVSGGKVVLEPSIGGDSSHFGDISGNNRYGGIQGRIVFSEPVHLPPGFTARLSGKETVSQGEPSRRPGHAVDLPLNQETPLVAILDVPEPERYDRMTFSGWEITDEAGNAMTDSLISFTLVSNPPRATGSIRGTIVGFSGRVVVEARDAATGRCVTYTVTDSANLNSEDSQIRYVLTDILPGFYTIFGHEQVGISPVPYYSGRWEPYQRAARFGSYPEVIEVRPRWEVDGIDINFKVATPILPLDDNAIKRE